MDQDKKIAAHAVKEGRGIVLVPGQMGPAEGHRQPPGVRCGTWCGSSSPSWDSRPIVPVSSLTGYGVRALLDTALEMWEPAAPARRHRAPQPGAGGLGDPLQASRPREELQDPVHDAGRRRTPCASLLSSTGWRASPWGTRQYLENCIRRDLGFDPGAGHRGVQAEQEDGARAETGSAMRAWGIGEVARLLGVKPHVIRYWESELPLLSPKKGLTGRREYSSNDVRLLMRFRHLLYEPQVHHRGREAAHVGGARSDRIPTLPRASRRSAPTSSTR